MIDKENAAAVGDQEPHNEQPQHAGDVLFPVKFQPVSVRLGVVVVVHGDLFAVHTERDRP